ncbi:unnamed protein product [Rotaria socialis]|uniref:Uncharacterized protein n=2 Tax=Rotaria socialis TaxID=392032 RepID=A0A817SFZ0_9BILA|nr:unnamed protein product [Rotaria socialis]
MESFNFTHIAGSLTQEPILSYDDDQGCRSLKKHEKTKQKKKPSTSSFQDQQKIKNRPSQFKTSRAQTKQGVITNREFIGRPNLQTTKNNCLSTVELMSAECENALQKNTLNFMEMTFDEKDTIQSLHELEATGSHEKEQIEHDMNIVNDPKVIEATIGSNETEKKNLILEEKLVQVGKLVIDDTIDLSSLNVTDNDIPLIIRTIFRKDKIKFTRLILRDNALTSVGVKMLVDRLLMEPMSVKNLGLSSNPDIRDDGIAHLVGLLRSNRSITTLAMHNTGITDQGIGLLADVLCDTKTRPALEKLYISFNKSITDNSLESLTHILEQNQTLTLLSLQHCSLSDRARQRLRRLNKKKNKKKFKLSE